MKTFLFAGLVLAGAPALAADNTELFVCDSKDVSIANYLYSKEQLALATSAPKTVRLTIGQDRTPTMPIFEIRMDLLDKNDEPVRDGKNTLRIAYVESPSTGRATVTYAPNRSTGKQGARPFSILIDEDGTGKLSFIQIGAKNAPNRPVELECQRSDKEVALPVSVDLSKLAKDQKVATMKRLLHLLPTRSHYVDEDSTVREPKGIGPSVLAAAKAHVVGLAIDAEAFKKRTYGNKDATVEITPAAQRCTEISWERFRPVRDFSNKVVGYRGDVKCKGLAAVRKSMDREDKKEIVEKFEIELNGIWAVGSELLTDAKTDYDFNEIHEKKSED